MEKTEPIFEPEWLKNSGSLSTTSHQSSLHSDDHGVSKSTRNKSLVNIGDNDIGRPSVSDRTTSSYFRHTYSSNDASNLRSHSSFGRNHRDRDWDKEKYDNRHRDYCDPLGNILPNRFEKDRLRRSQSNLSAKRVDSWPRKVTNGDNNGSAVGPGKTTFERDFPSLGTEEKQVDSESHSEAFRVPPSGMTSAIQSLPIGNSVAIGGDLWTSALAEVPVMVGNNGGIKLHSEPIQPTSVSSTTSVTTGRNMAETLVQGPPRAPTAPQVSVGTQRLEELAVKQSRQLIPMTPSMPKALVLNSSDKPKLKFGQLQLQNSHRPMSMKSDVGKVTSVGKLHILKPSREKNGITSAAKESLSPTGGGSKLPNNPPSAVAERKTCVEKRPSPQAQSRNDFFNLMRKKSMLNNSSSTVVPETVSSDSTIDKPVEAVNENKVDLSENKADLSCNGDSFAATDRVAKSGKILYSEEEEARFLRSLGWEETTEEEGLTEEEINAFYRDVSKYVNLKTASNFFRGTQPKCLMPLKLQMGKNGDICPDSKVDS